MFFLTALAIGMGGLFYHSKQTQNQLMQELEAGLKASQHQDWLAAFRRQMRLASTYNRQRPKEESFQPKW